MEAVEDEEVEVNTLDPPSRPSSPETLSSDSDSEFEDEAWDPISEDLVVETHEEVEVLFARLETDFTQMLRNAQLRLQEAERLKRRPSTYAKVNATHRNTIASRKRKALRQETEMRAKGYLDIRTFFEPKIMSAPSSQNPATADQDEEIMEEDSPDPYLHPSISLGLGEGPAGNTESESESGEGGPIGEAANEEQLEHQVSSEDQNLDLQDTVEMESLLGQVGQGSGRVAQVPTEGSTMSGLDALEETGCEQPVHNCFCYLP